MLHDRLLINLAIIKTNWDATQASILDNFMPIIGRAIQLLPDEEISEVELKQKVEDFSGFRIPSGALSVLIRRASRGKFSYVKRHEGLFVKNNEVLSTIDFSTRRQIAEKNIDLIKKSFREYCLDAFSHKALDEDFDTALLDVLSDLSPSLIASIGHAGMFDGNNQKSDTLNFFLSKFIIHIQMTDEDLFSRLLDIAKGAVVAELLYYTDETMMQKRMGAVRIYFDTPIVLQLLGYTPSFDVDSSRELLKMLSDMDAKLCIFSTTYDELRGIFSAASHQARDGWRHKSQPGTAFDILARAGNTSSDIELIISSLPERIAESGLRIDVPATIEESENIDHRKLDRYIDEEIPNQNEKARYHDVRALAAINQLRAGQAKRFFESCDAIFVTANSALARASVRFFNEEIGVSDAPICIPNHVFTMLMWLKSVNKKPNLPAEVLLANSLASINPSELLWDRYIEESARLRASSEISENDFNYLARALEAKAALMDITHGDASIVSRGTVTDVLRIAKESYAREVTEKYVASDQKRERFLAGLRSVVRRAMFALLVLTLVAAATAITYYADIASLFQPMLSWTYALTVTGVAVSVVSLVLGWSLRAPIDRLCLLVADGCVKGVRRLLW